MYRVTSVLAGTLLMFGLGITRAQTQAPATPMPLWAFGYPSLPSGAPAPPAPAAARPQVEDFPRTAPGSRFTWTRAQIMNPFGPAEFFPDEHPPMPEIVAKGRQAAKITACSLCHRAHGRGQPENAPVSGLPVSYFVGTMNDYRNGLRKSSDPKKNNAAAMVNFAKSMTDEEIKAAAEYFGSIPYASSKPWIAVNETMTVPKVRYVGNLAEPIGTETEPIGKRIIEVPEDIEMKDKYRSPHHGFLAYVPVGSIRRGRDLVTTGGKGKTLPCAVCHGTNLEGLGPVPGIKGRSPSYMVRQMHDMQTGSRNGEWAQLMKPVVARLTNDDLIDIAAYVASVR